MNGKPPALHANERVAWYSQDHFIDRIRVDGGWLYHVVYFSRLDDKIWSSTSLAFVPD